MRRGRTAGEVPPPLELECLRALWGLGEGTVQAVRDVLMQRKPLAYTTVMTMLDRLTRKQVLARRKVGRSFVYCPLVSRESVRQSAVRDLVNSLFDGDPSQLAAFLNGSAPKPAATAPEAEPDEPVTLDATLL
ncbi:MAG: BlaI/MecI/CopY family transcriptional regulator [Bryobacteraceae bacterium]|nr:BlaI/MecI/CopY family transcriptional regulator [Bryobacteraceae bacterium]